FESRHGPHDQYLTAVQVATTRGDQVVLLVLLGEPLGVVRQGVVDVRHRGCVGDHHDVHTSKVRPSRTQRSTRKTPVRSALSRRGQASSSSRSGTSPRSAGNQSTPATSSAPTQRSALCSTARGTPPPTRAAA